MTTDKNEINYVLEQKKRKDKHLEHLMMIAEFGVSLIAVCKQRPDIKLITWLPESNERQFEIQIPEEELTSEMRKWKDEGEVYGLTLKKRPDAVFGLEDKKGKMFFMLEVENTA